MQDTRMIFPEAFFVSAWQCDKISVVDMAKIYGTSRAAVYRAANRFELGQKNPPPEAPKEEPEARPKTYEGDLLWSEGRWSILREIAETYGKTLTQVQADLHKARANAK